MRIFIWSVCLILVGSAVAVGQDSTANAKIDTMLIYQRAMMDMQKKTLDAVQYDEPLADKTMGIELDPAYILYSSAGDYLTIPGTISFFNVSRRAELAFPFFYKNGTSHGNNGASGSNYDIPLTLLNIDATWRQFIGKHQDGLYFSGGLRYTYIKGVGGNGVDLGIFSINFGRGVPLTVSKIGAHFGLGYRVFTKSGFYWGTSLIIGRYFSNDTRDVQDVTLDDSKLIFDMELLKFGFAF
jgi:hypothetical protein